MKNVVRDWMKWLVNNAKKKLKLNEEYNRERLDPPADNNLNNLNKTMEDGDEEEILLLHHPQAAVEVEVVRIYLQVDVIKIQHLLQVAMKEDQHGVDETISV